MPIFILDKNRSGHIPGQWQESQEARQLWRPPTLKRLHLSRGTAIGHGTYADFSKPDGSKGGPHS